MRGKANKMKQPIRVQSSKVIVGIALLVSLSSCSSPAPAPMPSDTPTATQSSASRGEHEHGGDAGLEGTTESPSTYTRPQWSENEKKKARDVAEKATKAFVDSSKNREDWFAALSPFLTVDARSSYEYTDPKTMPFGKVKKVGTPKQNPDFPDFIDVPVQVAGGSLTVELHYSEDYKKLQVIRFTESGS